MKWPRVSIAWVTIFAGLLTGCYSSATVAPTSNDALYAESIQHVRDISDGWTLVGGSGDTTACVTVDSLGTEGLFTHSLGHTTVVDVDSIAFLIQEHPSVSLSTRSKLMGLAGAVVGGLIFYGQPPDNPDDFVGQRPFAYVVKSGAAIVVGAFVGFGTGYIIDLLSNQPEVFDLRNEPAERKHQIISEIFSQSG